jgi:hypothetical protein
MNSTVTFKNLDLLDSRSVEQAVGILWAAHRQAKQCVELFGQSEAEVREQFSRPRTFTLTDPNADTLLNEQGEEVPAPLPTKVQPKGFYKGTSKQLVEVMQERIAKNGSTTLEDAATVMGVTLDTARAFLRNAGRTNRARSTEFPFETRWNHDKGYNEYFAR